MEFTQQLGVRELRVEEGEVELELDANQSHWSTAERAHGGVRRHGVSVKLDRDTKSPTRHKLLLAAFNHAEPARFAAHPPRATAHGINYHVAVAFKSAVSCH